MRSRQRWCVSFGGTLDICFKSLCRLTTMKTPKLCLTRPLYWQSVGGFPSQRVRNAESLPMPWRHQYWTLYQDTTWFWTSQTFNDRFSLAINLPWLYMYVCIAWCSQSMEGSLEITLKPVLRVVMMPTLSSQVTKLVLWRHSGVICSVITPRDVSQFKYNALLLLKN